MRALLDTHVFLWWIVGDSALSSRVSAIIGDSTNDLFLSAASAWEIAIKARLGRLDLSGAPEVVIPEQMALNAIQSLPVQISHALHVYTLPDHHRDPFDRLLVAQSQLENMPIITADPQIARYAVEVIW
jgi:PIN domain nuclease of toxin-antitoxin system